MAKILLFGAGKSSSHLISYFLERANENNYELHVYDPQADNLLKWHENPQLFCHSGSIDDTQRCSALVQSAHIVISLLPAFLHVRIAALCLEHKKNLVTASYVDEAMKNLDADARAKGICFLNEAGLDPGIDHMSALHLIDSLKAQSANITSFESFTGGLIAPESDNNPWNYKLSWNPRNVVLAGAGSSARFIDHRKARYVAYPQLFQRTRSFALPDYGFFEGYANRDSMAYRQLYGLKNVETLIRGTLRRPGFSSAWNILVQLGLTDDSYTIDLGESCNGLTFFESFLPYKGGKNPKEQLLSNPAIPCSEADIKRLTYLGLFSTHYQMPKTKGTPAELLQSILEEKWRLETHDRDMIVMIHRIGFELNGTKQMVESSLVLEGESARYTAMSKTVGLPVAICAEEILHGNYHSPGVKIPNDAALYQPVLKKLNELGIVFNERFI